MKMSVKSVCCNAGVSPNAEDKCLNCQNCGANLGSNPYDKEKITTREITEEETWDFVPNGTN